MSALMGDEDKQKKLEEIHFKLLKSIQDKKGQFEKERRQLERDLKAYKAYAAIESRRILSDINTNYISADPQSAYAKHIAKMDEFRKRIEELNMTLQTQIQSTLNGIEKMPEYQILHIEGSIPMDLKNYLTTKILREILDISPEADTVINRIKSHYNSATENISAAMERAKNIDSEIKQLQELAISDLDTRYNKLKEEMSQLKRETENIPNLSMQQRDELQKKLTSLKEKLRLYRMETDDVVDSNLFHKTHEVLRENGIRVTNALEKKYGLRTASNTVRPITRKRETLHDAAFEELNTIEGRMKELSHVIGPEEKERLKQMVVPPPNRGPEDIAATTQRLQARQQETRDVIAKMEHEPLNITDKKTLKEVDKEIKLREAERKIFAAGFAEYEANKLAKQTVIDNTQKTLNARFSILKITEKLESYIEKYSKLPKNEGLFKTNPAKKQEIAEKVKALLKDNNLAKAVVENKLDVLIEKIKTEIKENKKSHWGLGSGDLAPVLENIEKILKTIKKEQEHIAKFTPPKPTKPSGTSR